MKALDQKFILSLLADPFLIKEIELMNLRWDIQGKNIEILSTAKNEKELPIEYTKDIEFILMQAILPERHLWPFHKYLITKKIPSIDELPKPARTFLRWNPLRNMGTRILEADIDASETEIRKKFTEFTESKEMLQKVNAVPIISQPLRDFEETIKILQSRDNIFDIVEDIAMTGKKGKAKKTRNKLEAKRFRVLNLFSKEKRISIEKREELEKFYRDNSPDF